MSLFGSLGAIRNKFLRDTATLQVAGLLNQTSQLVSTVMIAYLLGARGQGLFVSAIALQALFYFLINMGVVQATVSQLAAAVARGNEEKIAGWIAFMAKTILIIGTGIVVLGYFVLPYVGHWIYDVYETGPGGQGAQIGRWAWFLCFQPLLELPRVVAGVAFQGTRRMYQLGQIENGQEIVRLFLVVLGATLTGSPSGAIVGHLAACGVGSVLAIDIYRRARHDGKGYLPGVMDIMRRIRTVPMWRGMRLGLRVGLLKNGHALFINVFPRLIIGGVVGLDFVAYFHIAQRIMQVPLMLMYGVTRTAVPAMGALAGLKDMVSFRRLFSKISLITGGLITGGILLGVPLVEPFVLMAFPDDYAQPAARFYFILAFGYIPLAFGVALESFYMAVNKVRVWLWLTVVGAVITIPTNVYLIMTIAYEGTAWGLSLYQSWVIVHLCYVVYFFATSDRRETWKVPDEDPAAEPDEDPHKEEED